MTEASIGYGAELWLTDGTDPGVLTELAEIIAISLPNPTTSEVEATHFKSPNRRREYIAGLIEDGEGDFQLNYVPGSATSTLIREAQDSGEARAYKIVIPDGDGTWEIEGDLIVRGFSREVPIDDRMTATLSVRFTGGSTEAAGI